MNNTTQFQSTEGTNDGMKNLEYGFVRDRVILFLIQGIGVSIVSVVGMVGNILCFIVFSHPSMRTSTNIILMGLSVSDFVVLLMDFLTHGIPSSIRYFCVDSFESLYWTTLHPINHAYFYKLASIGQLGSTYFTLLVAMERCFVVYRPLLARPYCTNRNAVRASLVTMVFTILYILPNFWQWRLESVYDENGSWTEYRIVQLLSKNQYYELFYSQWLNMFVWRIIPMTLLTLLNISIYWKVREANKTRGSMTKLVNSSETSLAKMLMWVVSIFLFCNFCSLLSYVGVRYNEELHAVVFFLFTLNSTVNFIIYSVMAKKFRLVALELFWPKKWRVGRRNNVPMNPI